MGEKDRTMLKLVCLPLKALAEALDVPYGSVRNWSSGRTDFPDKHRPALARFMRLHAKRLEAAAEELEQ